MADYDMDPDGMINGINQFRAASDTFGKAWEGHRQELESALSGISGDDIVAQAFLEKYLPIANQLAADADALPKTYANFCDDAQFCVDEYNAANASGATTMNRVADSGMGEAPA